MNELKCPMAIEPCDLTGRTLWIRLWPFNFVGVDCPDHGLVDGEDWLWGKLFRVMNFLTPWDGRCHTERHPWWKRDGHEVTT